MHEIKEIWGDLNSQSLLIQLTVIAVSLIAAWFANRLLGQHIMKSSQENWQLGIGGVKRVLFPLTALACVTVFRVLLSQTQHTGALKLAATLLVAMAAIRLAVYLLRYIFAPSGWLRTTENFIVAIVWAVVALHLTGLLPDTVALLEQTGFSVGKRQISVLLILQAVITGAVTLVATLWIGRLLENKVMRAEQIELNLRVVFAKLIRILLIVVGVLAALSAIGFDITLLSVFGGALGVGLGFGLQKIASNYLSGFIILLDHSLHMGDVLTVDGHYGVVHQLRGRYLVLRKLDGTEVVIPNDTLITSTVINHSFSDRNARVQIPVQISYDSPLDKAMLIIKSAAFDHVRVLKTPEPDVLVQGLGENGIDLQLSVWVDDPEEGFGSLKSAIYMKILAEFKAAGVTIPYPQREVRMM
ncbi:mechanosensitive ion channel protein MscS [Novimethylophilus kurashikiensis]|uniref:Mechanosensitive ion channel protein MscS n=1 Tax=Novimethylophilus kurashikiensis TaxID=1825523 RepID=A0A2R5FAN4_9PROT|nr:mechanosensitive ion channel domain-containing protein [Novimethylophilus kurashikiensis]GBG15290.1 mechanosensitive ion channel protein MscS [Novimethylophilus kurashikiensis]